MSRSLPIVNLIALLNAARAQVSLQDHAVHYARLQESLALVVMKRHIFKVIMSALITLVTLSSPCEVIAEPNTPQLFPQPRSIQYVAQMISTRTYFTGDDKRYMRLHLLAEFLKREGELSSEVLETQITHLVKLRNDPQSDSAIKTASAVMLSAIEIKLERPVNARKWLLRALEQPFSDPGSFAIFKSPSSLQTYAKSYAARLMCRQAQLNPNRDDLKSCHLAVGYRGVETYQQLNAVEACRIDQKPNACAELITLLRSYLLMGDRFTPKRVCSSGEKSDVCGLLKLKRSVARIAQQIVVTSEAIEERAVLIKSSLKLLDDAQLPAQPWTETDRERVYWHALSLYTTNNDDRAATFFKKLCWLADDDDEWITHACYALSWPMLWDKVTLDEKLNKVSEICAIKQVKLLCVRLISEVDDVHRLTHLPKIKEWLSDTFHTSHYLTLAYQKLMSSAVSYNLHVDRVVISAKTSWGLEWDPQGGPEFLIQIKNKTGAVLYRDALKVWQQTDDILSLKSASNAMLRIPVRHDELRELYVTVTELDMLSDDHVGELQVQLAAQDLQVVASSGLIKEVKLSAVDRPISEQYAVVKALRDVPIEYFIIF